MNREQALRDANRLRTQARVLTRKGDLSRAQQMLKRLTASLEASLAEDADEAFDPATSRASVARALADSYGMLGGVAWRQGHLTEAESAYQRGRQIEQDEEFGISDSYNLVNSIILSILQDPYLFGSLHDEIVSAATVVEAQVVGERRDQWWAWADYALLLLLIGDADGATEAYDRFANRGPRLADYQSVTRVLQSLAEALRPVDVSVADRLTYSVQDLMKRGDAL